jgi:hypothetical protein
MQVSRSTSNSLRTTFAVLLIGVLAATAARAAAGAGARSEAAGGSIRVVVVLESSPLTLLPGGARADLAGRGGGGFAARERRRNATLPLLRRAAGPAVRAQEQLARQIVRLGGSVQSAGPGQLLAELPVAATEALARTPGVRELLPASRPLARGSVVDGSPTWHAAGYAGQVPNPDNASGDGPDVAIYDSGAGIRTGHIAFNARTQNDCDTCAGSGASVDPGHPEAGPNTRVLSPRDRNAFDGDIHASTIAAAIAATDFRPGGSGRGVAYGIDRLYDAGPARDPLLWMMGLTYEGEPGVDDLPEAMNYSWGVYEDEPIDETLPQFRYIDPLTDQWGITQAVAAGNCGRADSPFTGCDDGPHRVGPPANLYNVLSVGGSAGLSLDPLTWTAWDHSSPGPTWDGRKKPDLIATPFPSAKCPSGTQAEPFTYYSCGGSQGTSFAAPMVAGGAALLASVGVTSPIAQRAVLINSATPIQGQSYWTPTSGWGALNLATAFDNRHHFVNATITGAGTNAARFFRQTGVTPQSRTTLTWNRRNSAFNGANSTTPFSVTDLDLQQIDPQDGATTATGGSDADDTVDTNPTPSGLPGNNALTDNPMPGSGADGEDNVEQIRATGAASDTQILKVKAIGPVDGRTSEPFALAAEHPITALATPIPQVSVTTVPAARLGQVVEVTVTVTNPSGDLALSGVDLTVALPSGVSPTGPTNTSWSTIAAGDSVTTAFTLTGTAEGVAAITATATGSTYQEPFAGEGAATIIFDSTPPSLALEALPTWSAESQATANWSATDGLTGVASYDAEIARGSGSFTRVLDATSVTSHGFGGRDGELVSLRVRARDGLGNTSPWRETSTTFAAGAPSISFGTVFSPRRGQIAVPVNVSGSAPIVSTTYSFDVCACGAQQPLAGEALFTNPGSEPLKPVLIVIATDTLSRSVTRRQVFHADPALQDPRLKVTSARSRRGRLIVRGMLARANPARVRLLLDRRGVGRSRHARAFVRPVRGRWKSAFRLPKGLYRLVAKVSATRHHSAGKTTRFVRVH